MNKHMVLYLALVLLAVLGLGGMAIAGGIAQEAIPLQMETLEGDIEAVGDLQITLPFRADDHSHWETTFSAAADPDPTTTFTYSLQSTGSGTTPYATFRGAQFSQWFSTSWENISNETMLDEALRTPVQELAETLQPGEYAQAQISLSNYTAYFSFDLSLTIPERNGHQRYYDAPSDALQDYFSIPIPENMELLLSVSRSKDGEMAEIRTEVTGGLPYGFSNSCVADDWIYFVLSPADFPAGTDFSQIRGGYGLYRMPTVAEGAYELSVDALENVLPLSVEGLENIQVSASPWDGVLLLFEERRDTLTVQIFDEATCAVLQTLTLDAFDQLPGIVLGNNTFMLLDSATPLRHFQAFTRSDGQVVPCRQGTLENESFRWAHTTCAYRDGKLALLSQLWGERGIGLNLQVFGLEDTLFRGSFHIEGDDALQTLYYDDCVPALAWSGES